MRLTESVLEDWTRTRDVPRAPAQYPVERTIFPRRQRKMPSSELWTRGLQRKMASSELSESSLDRVLRWDEFTRRGFALEGSRGEFTRAGFALATVHSTAFCTGMSSLDGVLRWRGPGESSLDGVCAGGAPARVHSSGFCAGERRRKSTSSKASKSPRVSRSPFWWITGGHMAESMKQAEVERLRPADSR